MKIMEFIIKWLAYSVIMCYYTIYKGGKIGFVELSAILVGILIATIIYELVKYMITKIFNHGNM